MEITKEEFEDYERVRASGVTNMFDVRTVVELSNCLTRDKCLQIMKEYGELEKKYPNVRKED
mgnify:CR=1 FL=1